MSDTSDTQPAEAAARPADLKALVPASPAAPMLGPAQCRPLFAGLVTSARQSTAVASSMTRNCAGRCATPRTLVA
jgi:hypothetical protein